MKIAHRYVLLIALAEIADGVVTLLALGFYRPSWALEARLAALAEFAGRTTAEERVTMAREISEEEDDGNAYQ